MVLARSRRTQSRKHRQTERFSNVTDAGTQTVDMDAIVVDKAQFQAREKLSNQTIAEYQEAYFEGDELPPITLYKVEDALYLVDGFHRHAAMKRLGFEEVNAEVRTGTLADALLYAARANAAHGLRRTMGDAKRAAIIAIRGLLNQNPKKRPTVEQVKELAKVGTSTVQSAFSDLEAAGMDLGDKDTRGRKRKATTETHTESDTTTESETGTSDGDESGLTPEEKMTAQAAATKTALEELTADVRRRLTSIDAATMADPGSEVRLAWVATIHMLNGLADEIREKIGMPTSGGEDFQS